MACPMLQNRTLSALQTRPFTLQRPKAIKPLHCSSGVSGFRPNSSRQCFGMGAGLQKKRIERKVVVTAQQGGSMDMNAQWKKGRNDGPMSLPWKIVCALLYFFPLQEVGTYGHTFIERFPLFNWVDQVTVPFEYFFNCHEFAPLAWFFGLYLGIVKNRKIPHVARYHIMLGTMIDIIGMIFSILRENLPYAISWGPYYWWFVSGMFWLILCIVAYCMVFALKGWYAEIPILSDATYLQVEQAEMLDRDATEGYNP